MAWSRTGGDWHQVHVEYPTHFGYGQRPQSVLLNGALRTLLWGVIAFVVLPIVADAAWNIGSDAFDTLNDAATLGFVALGRRHLRRHGRVPARAAGRRPDPDLPRAGRSPRPGHRRR